MTKRLTSFCIIPLLLLVSLMLMPGVSAGGADNGKPATGSEAPALLWKKSFDPPLKLMSDRNSNGDFLAVQLNETGMPWKLLVIDGKGVIRREENLPGLTKTPVTEEQGRLEAGTDFGVTGTAKGLTSAVLRGKDIKVSGSGEYYAVLIPRDNGGYEIAYKEKSGETLQTIASRDGYGLFHFQISYDGNTIVVVDTQACFENDNPHPGQRVRFYNAKELIREYDYRAQPEARLDTDKILISKNGRYVAATRGSGENSAFVLFDNNGHLLLEKHFFDRHYLHDITNNGEILVSDYDWKKEARFVDKEGNIIWKKDPPILADILVSDNGGYLIHGKDLVDAKSGKTVYRIDSASLFGDAEINATGYVDVPREGKPLVLVFGYNACCGKFSSALVNFREDRVLWRKDKTTCNFANDGKLIFCGNYQVYTVE